MPKTEKIEKVAALKNRIESSQALLLADFRGLTVTDATDVRSSLREAGTSFAVVKNTLMKRAADEAGLAELAEFLEGPTGIAFVEADPVVAAKAFADAAKKFPALVLKGGYLEGRMLSGEEAKALATLDSREVMLSKIAGLMKGEMSRAASMFVNLQSRFVGLMEALRDKMPADEAPAAVESEASEAVDSPSTAPSEDSVAGATEAEPEAAASGDSPASTVDAPTEEAEAAPEASEEDATSAAPAAESSDEDGGGDASASTDVSEETEEEKGEE
jgi:large subunit ribosomal protein L10